MRDARSQRGGDDLRRENGFRAYRARYVALLSGEAVSDHEHFLERIQEVTTIPENKRSDLDFLRAAVMLAHVYAGAALAPIPEPAEAPADPMTLELPGMG